MNTRRDSHEHYVAGQAPDWARRAQMWRPLVETEPSDVFDMQEHIDALRLAIEDTKAKYFARGVLATLASFAFVLAILGALFWTLKL